MQDIIDRQTMLEEVPDYDSIIENGEQFVDNQFLPCSESMFSTKQIKFLWDETNKHYTNTREEFNNCVGWIRLSKLFHENELSVADNVSPEDVKQGGIGDGYLMSLLSTIADKWPQEIEEMFRIRQINSSGGYAIRLMINGHYRIMVIDDYVPYDKLLRKLIYAK